MNAPRESDTVGRLAVAVIEEATRDHGNFGWAQSVSLAVFIVSRLRSAGVIAREAPTTRETVARWDALAKGQL